MRSTSSGSGGTRVVSRSTVRPRRDAPRIPQDRWRYGNEERTCRGCSGGAGGGQRRSRRSAVGSDDGAAHDGRDGHQREREDGLGAREDVRGDDDRTLPAGRARRREEGRHDFGGSVDEGQWADQGQVREGEVAAIRGRARLPPGGPSGSLGREPLCLADTWRTRIEAVSGSLLNAPRSLPGSSTWSPSPSSPSTTPPCCATVIRATSSSP